MNQLLSDGLCVLLEDENFEQWAAGSAVPCSASQVAEHTSFTASTSAIICVGVHVGLSVSQCMYSTLHTMSWWHSPPLSIPMPQWLKAHRQSVSCLHIGKLMCRFSRHGSRDVGINQHTADIVPFRRGLWRTCCISAIICSAGTKQNQCWQG